MYTLDNFIADQNKNPKVKASNRDLKAELSLMGEVISARTAAGMTQQELSKKTGISQADLSRIENANACPSLKTIKRLADGLGMDVEIKFVPRT